jgi:hypothetical protein
MNVEDVNGFETHACEPYLCDGRKMRDRKARREFHCTCCGGELPKKTSEWGLIWDSKKDGFCVKCLNTIRERTKVKPRRKRKSKP